MQRIDWNDPTVSLEPEYAFFRRDVCKSLYGAAVGVREETLGEFMAERLRAKSREGACVFSIRDAAGITRSVVSVESDARLSRAYGYPIGYVHLFAERGLTDELADRTLRETDQVCVRLGLSLVRCKTDPSATLKGAMFRAGFWFYAATCKMCKQKADSCSDAGAEEIGMVDLKLHPELRNAALACIGEYDASEKFCNPFLPAEGTRRYYREWLRALLDSDSSRLWGIAERGAGALRGLCCISRSSNMSRIASSELYTFDFLMLRPGHRFRGAGTAVMAFVEGQLAGATVEASHSYDNTGCRNLLAKFGYVNTNTFDFYTKCYNRQMPEREKPQVPPAALAEK